MPQYKFRILFLGPNDTVIMALNLHTIPVETYGALMAELELLYDNVYNYPLNLRYEHLDIEIPGTGVKLTHLNFEDFAYNTLFTTMPQKYNHRQIGG
jgi:hypothetical protein